MVDLPKRLQDDSLRFILVYPKKKNPIETGWQKTKNYKYNDSIILQHLKVGGNVGIICGEQSDGLRILDDDTPNKEMITLFLENFGETFRVRDHLYFKFDTKDSDKIILNHESKLYPDSNGKLSSHLGEIQGTSTFCVTNPSIHPSGKIYELKKDLPIVTISYNKFIEIFGDYIKKKKVKLVTNHTPTSWKGDNITDIPLGSIISFNGLRESGDAYQGPHPGHGSENGMNFRIDKSNNSWYCFRCQSGGGPSELIGVMGGIIQCYEAGPSCYTSDQGIEVIKLARERYGLSTPEPTQKDLGDVKGWANSVSILKLAKKHNLEDCPVCKNPFKFQDSHGMYYCKTCKYGGGLNKFAALILKNESVIPK